jgi:alkanesulfonate monooxygenase SsuD/methylene tetrahydromethanopterin reductase-like flavin-dependent oxidoreductase (luciferase family)
MSDRSSRLAVLGDNPLKFGVFGVNVSNGCAITTADGTIEVNWPESVELARAADRAGIEAMVPVARWKGFGGSTNFNHRTFETYTWAAGLAQATERIAIFATSHVPTIHPVLAAKQATTIDHISGGRFGLNIVAGWNATEFEMFGKSQLPHEERYEAAEEWIELIKRLWTEPGSFDFRGRYFDCPGAYAEPKPLQQPYPLVMSAGVSPTGREFAAKHADLNFLLAPDLDVVREIVADVRRLAAKNDREVSIWGMTAIVVGDNEKDARDFYRYYVDEKGDWEAARNLLGGAMPESGSFDPAREKEMLRHMVEGYAALPIIGSAEQVTEQLIAFKDTGVDGVTLSWVNYREGLERFSAEVMPLLEQAGLRKPGGATS